MNANFGLVDDLEKPERDKKRKKQLMADRALRDIDAWITANDLHAVTV
jgi:folate-dependent tRNA-U54 methylase TrmFO/GidA